MGLNPKLFKIELRDTNFNLIKLLQNNTTKCSWNYNKFGGCGNATVTVDSSFDFLNGLLFPDYEISIYQKVDETTDWVLYYKGLLDKFKYNRKSGISTYTINCVGHSSALKRIIVEQTFTSQEVSGIVKFILDTYILPNTDITYDEEDIEPSDFIVDQIDFNTKADECMRTLAELAGAYEFGVDRNRKFYFKKQSDVIQHTVNYKKNVSNHSPLSDFNGIVNRLVIKGGGDFRHTVNNSDSQNSFGLREDTTSNSSIVTVSVANQYGTAILSEKARIQQRMGVDKISNTELIEENVPLGKMSVVSEPVAEALLYNDDAAIYGEFVYGGLASYQINTIKYSITDKGTDVVFELGLQRPNQAREIKKLEFEIEQLRNA